MSAPGNLPSGVAMCPSAPAAPGHLIYGANTATGVVFLDLPIVLDARSLEEADQSRTGLRVAGPCLHAGCSNWNRGCGLARNLTETSEDIDALPPCALRPICLWYRQEGPRACGPCPHLTHQNSLRTSGESNEHRDAE